MTKDATRRRHRTNGTHVAEALKDNGMIVLSSTAVAKHAVYSMLLTLDWSKSVGYLLQTFEMAGVCKSCSEFRWVDCSAE